jgi:hypothetical protein
VEVESISINQQIPIGLWSNTGNHSALDPLSGSFRKLADLTAARLIADVCRAHSPKRGDAAKSRL